MADRPGAVVVGGGMVGVCTALQLQRSGRAVTLIERQRPGDGASGHNAGIFSIGNIPTATPGVVRSVPQMLRDPLSPLAIRLAYLPRMVPWLARFLLASRPAQVERVSLALYSLLDQALDAYRPLLAGDGVEPLMRSSGLLYAYRGDRGARGAQFDLDLRRRRGVSLQVLDGAAIGELDPAMAGRFRHGIYLPGAEFTIDVRGLNQRLADRVVAGGGQVVEGDVVGFETRGDRLEAVSTTTGRVPAEAVVLAAGAWSRPLARQLGVRVSLDTERGYGVDLPDPGVELSVPVICMDHHVALTPTSTGVRLAGTAELAGLSAPANYARADRLIDAARVLFPELRTDGAQRWMSYRPSTPDSLPVIGRAPRYENAYLAFGHGHVGLTLAAITGKLVQELMDGAPTTVDLHPFRPTRFSVSTIWQRSARNGASIAARTPTPDPDPTQR